MNVKPTTTNTTLPRDNDKADIRRYYDLVEVDLSLRKDK